MTCALQLVNFPLAFPGTAVWHAVRARKYAVAAFERASAASKVRMAAGEEPTCLLDQWVSAILEANRKKSAGEDAHGDSKHLLRDFSDNEIALVILSFIFASQVSLA